MLAFLRLVKRTKKTKHKGLLLFLTFTFCCSLFSNPVLAQQQNDAGTGGDVDTLEVGPGTYSGLVDRSDEFGGGGSDCYTFYVEAGTNIRINASILDTSPEYISLDVALRYPAPWFGEKVLHIVKWWLCKATGEINFIADKSGYWSVVFDHGFPGAWVGYTFTLSLEEVDFALAATPSSGSVPPGGSTTATITVSTSESWPSDYAILLSTSGAPSGADVTLSDFMISLAHGESTSTMTVSTSDNMPLGGYTIAITGTGGGKTRTENWLLNVGVATTLEVSPSSFVLDPSEEITLTATLTSNGEPLSGKTINWHTTVGGISAASGTTNGSGQTPVAYTAPSTAGDVTITASFAGDTQYAASNGNTIGTVIAIPEEKQPLESDFPWWAILLVALGSIVGLAAYLKRRRPGQRRKRVKMIWG